MTPRKDFVRFLKDPVIAGKRAKVMGKQEIVAGNDRDDVLEMFLLLDQPSIR